MKYAKRTAGIVVALLLVACLALTAGCGNNDAELKVELNLKEIELFEGEETELTATPSDPSAELKWVSANERIASVSANGAKAVVTAVSAGTTYVKVLSEGSVKAQCAVTVVKRPEKVAINLPAGKLVLGKTGDSATLKVRVVDESIDESAINWEGVVFDPAVVTVEFQAPICYVTAVAEGKCTVTVNGNYAGELFSASCEVTVLKTFELDTETKSYYAYTPGGVRSAKSYYGLSNAVSALVNDSAYGAGSYLTTTEDTATRVYTFTDKAYSFFMRSKPYTGYDSNINVTDGQADYWDGFYLQNQLNLFNNTDANMLQTKGTLKNSWYYRKSEIVTAAGNEDLNAGKKGYRDSLYTAAGAGMNYATWEDGTAYDLTRIELNYDLSGATLTPSKSGQSVYAEIYMRTLVAGAKDKTKYYGAYFDAGTAASTSSLANGTKRYWYAYEGSMCYQDSEHVTWPCQSKITLNEAKPIGYATWDSVNGKWVIEDLKIKLVQKYRFTDETSGGQNCKLDFSVTGTQNGTAETVDFVYDAGAKLDRGPARFTYGVSFTPKAPMDTTKENAYGFYGNTAVPDIHNGGTWLGVKQGACTGYKKDNTTRNLSFYTVDARQYVGIWGTDVCSYKKNVLEETTTFNFRF